MDGQLPAVEIVRFVTEQIEKLAVHQRSHKIEGRIGIRQYYKQGGFLVAQSIQLQFVIGGQITQLLNIEGSQPRTAANQNRLSCFARDELSRTF